MYNGVYCLILENEPCGIVIGARGLIEFSGGWHVYCGSAQGPGGLSRVTRHVRVTREGMHRPRWHIDYLLVHPYFRLRSVVCAPANNRETECRLAGIVTTQPVSGFGCSDCACRSHLGYFESNPENDVVSAFYSLGLTATIKTINIS